MEYLFLIEYPFLIFSENNNQPKKLKYFKKTLNLARLGEKKIRCIYLNIKGIFILLTKHIREQKGKNHERTRRSIPHSI